MSNNLIPLKKPLNALDNPVYADIRGPPPRFYDSGKHWTVDVGQTNKQVEFTPDYQDYAILAQSRSYNTDIYGKSSSKDVVNKAFRPPLITLEDTLPLNRLPREFVIPHTNPWTNEYQLMPDETALMTRFTSVDEQHYTTDRIKHGYTFPSYYRPLDIKENIGGVVGVMPDLKIKLPQFSAYAGTSTQRIGINNPMQKENYSPLKLRPERQQTQKSALSTSRAPYKHVSFDSTVVDTENNMGLSTTTKVDQKIPYSSFSTGMSKKVHTMEQQDFELDEKITVKGIRPNKRIPVDIMDRTMLTSLDGSSTAALENEKITVKGIRPNKRIPVDIMDRAALSSVGGSYMTALETEKISIKDIRPNKRIPADIMDRKVFSLTDGNTKLEKYIHGTPLKTPTKQVFKSSNNYKKPDFKQKEAFLHSSSYHTKGYIPQAGIATGEQGSGLNQQKTLKIKQKKGR